MEGKEMAILVAILAMLLTSCAVGPDYSRPKLQMPDSFRMAEDAERGSMANLPWWELLHDKELQKLIRIALEENKDLTQAIASMEEYGARVLVARTDFIPQLSATVNAPAFGRMTRFLVPGFPNPFNYYVQGNLNWEIDIWGRIRRGNEAARAELFAREENRRAIILQLVSGVAEAYFDLLQFDMQLDIAKNTLKSWEESVKIAQARLRQGVISKLDADQFEAERANAAARAAELERQMIQKENQISVLLGRNPQPIARGRSLTEQVLPPAVPPGLPSELLQRRPDVVHAEQTLHAATARIGMAKADRFPKLSLTGILGVANPRLTKVFDVGGVAGGDFGVLGPSLTAPLLNASILGFQQEAAEALARGVLAQYEQSLLVAFREVEDALVAVRTARTQREAQAEQVAALRSALHLANLRYKGGLANYLDVLIAQRSLFDAELSLTSTHRFHLVSIVQLYKALGGGWPPSGTKPEEPSIALKTKG
jgi:outer membrane protein, multidrug efflux system